MGQSFVIEIDPQMSLEDIMALLEAEVWFHSSIEDGMPVSLGTRSQEYPQPSRASHGMVMI